MKALLAALMMAAAAPALAQGTGTNPVAGSVWTYLGPTFGAGWVAPGGPPYVPFIVPCNLSGPLTLGNMKPEESNYVCGGVKISTDIATNNMANSAIAAFDVYHGWGGTGAGEGSRMGIWVNLEQKGPIPFGSGTQHFQTGIFSNVFGNFSEGGNTPLGVMGELYGFAAQVTAGPNYLHTVGLTGGEIDVANYSPDVELLEGWGIAMVPLVYNTPATMKHALQYEAALGIWATAGTPGFATGISFGRLGNWGIADHGTMIGISQGSLPAGSMTADHGIDFSLATFHFDSINVPGLRVLSGGTMVMSNGFPTFTFNPGTASSTARLTYSGANTYCWQTNTAPAGDFSSGFDAYCTGPLGDISLGPGVQVATNAINGFARIGSMPGAPTGVPQGAGTGNVPIAVDSTNNKLCYFVAGVGWRCL